jgi:hypothetical protein
MRRRTFLGLSLGLAAATLVGTESVARAKGRDARVVAVTASAGGVTLELAPKAAPYPDPAGSAAYDDPTVLVFVPSYYRLPKAKKIDFVVHFHGHMTTAKDAIANHRLREQLAESRQNAVLVVPQGPVRAADGDFGKVMRPRGLAKLLDEVRSLLVATKNELGDAVVSGAKASGRVIVSGHSGGYRAAARVATQKGVDLREVYLFDALYGEVTTFRDWVAAAPERHKLVCLAIGGTPRTLSAELANELRAKGVTVVSELGGERLSRADLIRGRAVFLEGHGVHASAAVDEAPLRACLHASCLKRRGSREWLDDRDATRAT